MQSIVLLIVWLLNVYIWMVIGMVIASWLVAFDVLNMRNKWVYKAMTLLNAVTRPPMDAVRRYVPPVGGVDLTPMVVIFGIYLVQSLLLNMLF